MHRGRVGKIWWAGILLARYLQVLLQLVSVYLMRFFVSQILVCVGGKTSIHWRFLNYIKLSDPRIPSFIYISTTLAGYPRVQGKMFFVAAEKEAEGKTAKYPFPHSLLFFIAGDCYSQGEKRARGKKLNAQEPVLNFTLNGYQQPFFTCTICIRRLFILIDSMFKCT